MNQIVINQVITESLVISLESFDELINQFDCGRGKSIFKQANDWINLVDCYFLEVGAVATWEDFITKAIKENKVHLIYTLIHEARNILRQVV